MWHNKYLLFKPLCFRVIYCKAIDNENNSPSQFHSVFQIKFSLPLLPLTSVVRHREEFSENSEILEIENPPNCEVPVPGDPSLLQDFIPWGNIKSQEEIKNFCSENFLFFLKKNKAKQRMKAPLGFRYIKVTKKKKKRKRKTAILPFLILPWTWWISFIPVQSHIFQLKSLRCHIFSPNYWTVDRTKTFHRQAL